MNTGAKASDTPFIDPATMVRDIRHGSWTADIDDILAQACACIEQQRDRAERAEAVKFHYEAACKQIGLSEVSSEPLAGAIAGLQAALAKARDEALEKAAKFVETRELLFARCRASGATREVDDIKEYLMRGILGLKGKP